jgi:hypothetical protein
MVALVNPSIWHVCGFAAYTHVRSAVPLSTCRVTYNSQTREVNAENWVLFSFIRRRGTIFTAYPAHIRHAHSSSRPCCKASIARQCKYFARHSAPSANWGRYQYMLRAVGSPSESAHTKTGIISKYRNICVRYSIYEISANSVKATRIRLPTCGRVASGYLRHAIYGADQGERIFIL